MNVFLVAIVLMPSSVAYDSDAHELIYFACNILVYFFNFFSQEVPEHAAYEDTSAALGGVGITFIKDSDNNYIVNLLVKWGPAHKCKQIRQGDKLVSIDGLDIQAGGKAGLPLVNGLPFLRHFESNPVMTDPEQLIIPEFFSSAPPSPSRQSPPV